MAKSNHSTALPIEAPVTALRTSDVPPLRSPRLAGMAILPKVSVPLSISLTGDVGPAFIEKDSGRDFRMSHVS